jgi:glycosyltransferase involved in cell wall biosynthesis
VVCAPASPFFSVLITAYNRQDQIERCVRSCTQQTFEDFEIVVVDDASTDATADVVASLGAPRVRVVRHERNRGTSPARATAVDQARGEWIVRVDSDEELLPGALARLKELIGGLPDGVHIVRFRYRLDDGRVVPDIMPSGVTDYRGRLSWLEAVAVGAVSTDAGDCMHRSVLEGTNYFRDRRGAVEALWELNLARTEPSLWVDDVLSRFHTDAPNRYDGHSGGSQLIARLLADAPDQLWMAEEMLAQHGSELARFAPSYRRWLVESAAREALLAGDRVKGIRHSRAAVAAGASVPKISALLVLGLAGPRTLARAKVAGRNWRHWRGGAATARRIAGR